MSKYRAIGRDLEGCINVRVKDNIPEAAIQEVVEHAMLYPKGKQLKYCPSNNRAIPHNKPASIVSKPQLIIHNS